MELVDETRGEDLKDPDGQNVRGRIGRFQDLIVKRVVPGTMHG
jgi:hypothetical protein